MGEDMLGFVIATERRDLEDAASLLEDLREGLARMEKMLTDRWREIARLTRALSKRTFDPFPCPQPDLPSLLPAGLFG